MKKIFTLKNIFLALLLTTSLTATAETGWTVEYDNGIAIFYSSWKGGMKVGGLTFRTGFDGYVNIPETVEIKGITYNVVRIGENIANGSGKVHYVTLPETVNYICDNAFYNCRELKEINIPAAVTYIGEGAFYGCKMLTSIAIPEGVDRVCDYTFYKCDVLTEIVIPNTVTSIGSHAFCGCDALTSLSIPQSITSIGESAFACSGLTFIELPNSVISIEKGAFKSCEGLISITIPENMTSIAAETFYSCSCLESVTLHSNVETIGEEAFRYCSALTSIVIPDGVTNIGDGAFSGCSNVIEVYSYSIEPPTCGSNCFESHMAIPLYVPIGSYDAYATADEWCYFASQGEIREFDVAGIGHLTPDNSEITGYYTLDGKAATTPQKGINIVRYSDGSTKKMVVR